MLNLNINNAVHRQNLLNQDSDRLDRQPGLEWREEEESVLFVSDDKV
jgi:hypothetical protein